jgi:6-phosphofructokinase
MANADKLAIIVAGGPAPGINSVIGAATIRACLSGCEVLGIQDGFQWLMKGETNHVIPLDIQKVSRIHFRGGSFIGISRANPTQDPMYLDAVLMALTKLGVGQVITIGGDDTAYTAHRLSQYAAGRLRVVHVPKTIDNDLYLPESIPTFGFQTARHVGVGLVRDLLTDARTTTRWYFVVTMGRKAGHLALGIGKAAGATVTIIPEEFPERIRLDEIVDNLACAILKRLSLGRSDGVAVIAEGLVERLDPAEFADYGVVERDAHGNLRIAEVNFADLLKARVMERLAKLNIRPTIATKNLGYEMRCTDPIPYDMEYTRDLGYCAAKYLLEGGSDVMITTVHGVFTPVPLSDLIDPETGRTRIRLVDIRTESYRIARRFMIRLRRDDLADERELSTLAVTAGLTIEKFREQFEYLVRNEPPPIKFIERPTPANGGAAATAPAPG